MDWLNGVEVDQLVPGDFSFGIPLIVVFTPNGIKRIAIFGVLAAMLLHTFDIVWHMRI